MYSPFRVLNLVSFNVGAVLRVLVRSIRVPRSLCQKKYINFLDNVAGPVGNDYVDDLEEGDALFEFVKCLGNAVVQEQLKEAQGRPGIAITLPEGVVWFGDSWTFSNQLFVRQAYIELREARKQRLSSDTPESSTTILTGILGIGKSHLATLMVADALIAGRVVILERRGLSSEGRRGHLSRLELPKGKPPSVSWLHRTEDAIKALRSAGKNGVYVVDGGSPSIDVNFDYPCESLVFASAKPDVLKIARSTLLS